MNDENTRDQDEGLDPHGARRRTMLACMAWAGAGMLWTVSGGVPGSRMMGGGARAAESDPNAFTFVQISDSHIGFNKDPNMNPASTLAEAIDLVRTMPARPAFMIHTGDVSHLSKPAEFDTAMQIIGGARLPVHYVPGEHDVLVDDGHAYFERFPNGAAHHWYSFDQGGVHFIGLTNVLDLRGGGLGFLGDEQLAWLRQDLSSRSSSTPLVVFAHIPLWALYPAWGWGTDDSAQALGLMKRFGSVTVLNGHVHQIAQKVEGDMTFYTAMSTAFPQPAPGAAAGPGPLKVPAPALRALLGVRSVSYVRGHDRLAVTDYRLDAAPTPPHAQATIVIDNFSFNPPVLHVGRGATVTWDNRDDIPHLVVSDHAPGTFRSPPLDTGERFSTTFMQAGTYRYFCAIHPRMTGRVIVD